MLHFYSLNKLDQYSCYLLSEVCQKYKTEYTVHEQFYFPDDYEFQENSTHVFLGSDYLDRLRETVGLDNEKLKTIQGFIFPFENDVRFTFFYALPYLFLNPNSLLDLEQIVHVSTLPIDPDLSNCINNVLDDTDKIGDLYERLKHTHTPVALDLETSGLSSHDDEILCIAIGLSETESYIIPKEKLDHLLVKNILVLQNVQWVGHNAKFDAGFLLQRYGIHVTFTNDTMLLHYILDERQGTHGLKPLSRRLLGLSDYEEEIRHYLPTKNSSYALIPSDVLYEYAGFDVCFTLRLLDRLELFLDKAQASDKLCDVYDFLLQASDMFVDIEQTGMYFDIDTAKELEKSYFEKEEDLKNQLAELTHKEFNPASPKQVADYLYHKLNLEDPYQELEKKPRCTDKQTLTYLSEKYPDIEILQLILEIRKISKIRSTYITALINCVNTDQRLRTQIKLHGTVTGRLSSSQPNFQNFPRAARNEYARPIRNLITATDEDTILLGADYSQCIAQDTFVSGNVLIQDHPNAVYKGEKETIELFFSTGGSLVCTLDHRIFTSNGWIEAQNLTKDHFIACQGFNPPVRKSDDWLVGFCVADGYVRKGEYSLAKKTNYSEVQQKVSEYIDSKLFRDSGKSSNDFRCLAQGDRIDQFLSWFDKKDLRMNKFDGDLATFLSGLFDGDGTASLTTKTISLANKSKVFLQDIQQILFSFGIHSTIIKQVGGKNWYPGGKIYYRLQFSDLTSVQNFNANIGFCFIDKATKANEIEETLSVRTKKNIVPIPVEYFKDNGYSYRKWVFNHRSGRPYGRHKSLNNSVEHPLMQYHWTKLQSIKVSGKKPVYDLVNQPNQRFIANSVVVHNCEIRVAATLSQEPFYQRVYAQGLDVHTETAKMLFNLSVVPCEGEEGYAEFTEQRSLAKNLNFGLIYGQGASAIARLYGMEVDEAQSLYDQFYETIPNLAQWLQETREFAYENGYCTTSFGRQRRFGFCISPELLDEIGFGASNQWRIKTMAGNFAIQSLASDITLQAAIDLHQKLRSSNFIHGKILVLVHDAIYLEVPKRSVNIASNMLEKYMLEAPKKILKTDSQGNLFVPFAVDMHTDQKWGEL